MRKLLALLAAASAAAVLALPAGAVSNSDIDAARDKLHAAQQAAESAGERASQAERQVQESQGRIRKVEADIEARQHELDAKLGVLKARAVTAYKHGGSTPVDVIPGTDLQDGGRREVYLTRVMASDDRAVRELAAIREDLDSKRASLVQEHAKLAAAKAEAERQYAQLEAAKKEAQAATDTLVKQKASEDAATAARAREALVSSARGGGGGDLPVDGLVCPVKGSVSFIDSWGFPRSGGRRHQGADMMTAAGTPLVAITSGTISKTGNGGLGGITVWLNGDNGVRYYYAHNSSNVVSTGQRVSTGQLVAYAGSSGNAAGGPPHLHFEVHPGGGAAVNPYPTVARVC
ncbi:MAG: peptidoglycan DD-metalloendopeptidase family protein [Acidimicrobiia bacterium]